MMADTIRVLSVILLLFFILVEIWFYNIIDHEEKHEGVVIEKVQSPKELVIVKLDNGTIIYLEDSSDYYKTLKKNDKIIVIKNIYKVKTKVTYELKEREE